MLRHVGTVTLASVLVLGVGGASRVESQPRVPQRGLDVPVTGSVVGGGSFTGTLTLQKFVVREEQIVALGAIAGTATVSGASRSGIRAVVELPVTVSDATGAVAHRGSTFSAHPMIRLVQQTCGIARVQVGANNVDLLGVTVALDPVLLEVSGNSAGPLGNLACQILAAVNNVANLVGLLNLLLGALTGGLGGLAGGALPI